MERKPQFNSDGIQHATINGHRFHLRRKDPTKDNFLWIDGRQPPLILDPTAADFVEHLIEAMWRYQSGAGDESTAVIQDVVDKMFQQYGRVIALGKRRVTRARIRADLDRIFGTIMGIAEGECPVDMELGAKQINYGEWIAPARMDLALTYRCTLKCAKCYLGNKRLSELNTEQWLKIYEILWGLGIPQIVFTGGEPTLRDDLVQLVSEADEFVTGLITNGTKLYQLAEPLKDASLDYAQITIESFDADVHDQMTGVGGSHAQTVAGIRKSLAVGLQVVTNTTLTRWNSHQFIETIKWLAGIGIKNIACNTLICSGRGISCKNENGIDDKGLKPILIEACQAADSLGMNFQWYSPTCYHQGINPLELGLGIKACSAAAHNMTIQPDGTVLPCQSWPEAVGNILTDKWGAIWQYPTCQKLRNLQFKSEACHGCEFEFSCAGGCPLDQSERYQPKEGR